MKQTTFTFFLLTLFFSCQTESIDKDLNSIPDEKNIINNSKLYDDFLENGQNGQLFSDFIKVDKKKSNIDSDSQRRDCTSIYGYNNLDTCNTIYNLDPISTTTAWNVSDNGSGYIDFELDNFFSNHCQYSYFCYNPGGSVVQTMTGEVEFYESPTFTIDPILGDTYVYYYLSDVSIPIDKGNELADFFVCKMKEYRDEHLPGAWIVGIDFYGDALLCSSNGLRYLKATFTLNLHNTGTIKS